VGAQALTIKDGGDFQHILRILGTNVDGKQKVMYAMTSVKGIGRRFSNIVCKKADVDMDKRAGALSLPLRPFLFPYASCHRRAHTRHRALRLRCTLGAPGAAVCGAANAARSRETVALLPRQLAPSTRARRRRGTRVVAAHALRASVVTMCCRCAYRVVWLLYGSGANVGGAWQAS